MSWVRRILRCGCRIGLHHFGRAMVDMRLANLMREIVAGRRSFEPRNTGDRRADLERFQGVVFDLETLGAAGFIGGLDLHKESTTGEHFVDLARVDGLTEEGHAELRL